MWLGSQLVSHEQISEPKKFRAAIAKWRREPQLWIDTEVADWWTPTPRLSLLQVRAAAGPNIVVDVLDRPMRQVLDEEFIPQIMASKKIEKWAHYARHEQRFLGQDRVENLNCTFEMARALPYYRLPLLSLSLAALVKNSFNQEADKRLQKADWGVRPLSQAHIEYAASDTEWCYKIYHKLRAIPRRPNPSEDDPIAIQTRYNDLLIPLKKAQVVRTSIRDAVKEFMTGSGLRRLSRFELHAQTTYSTDLRTFIEFASAKDPGIRLDLGINLSAKQRSALSHGVLERLRPFAEIRQSQSFRGPRAPRLRDESANYDLNPQDHERLTRDYETAEHEFSTLDSERGELRERMKAWLGFKRLQEWGEFYFSEPSERWKVDVRALQEIPSAKTSTQIPFPQRVRLAFTESDIGPLIAAGQSKQIAVLRWLPRGFSVGLDAQLSRAWHEPDSD
jgi:ribonuclease D